MALADGKPPKTAQKGVQKGSKKGQKRVKKGQKRVKKGSKKGVLFGTPFFGGVHKHGPG